MDLKNNMKEKYAFQRQLHRECISKAIAAARLRDEGKTMGQIMDSFGVSEKTVIRWFGLVERKVKDE